MSNDPKTEAFTFYASYYEASKYMPDEMGIEYLKAILDYAFEGKEPNRESANPIVMAAFVLARPNIDSSIKNKQNGAKGGSAKKADDRSNEARKPTRKAACKPASGSATSNKDKERDKEEEKDKDGKGDKDADAGDDKRAVTSREGPPTLESVDAFVKEEGLAISAGDFFNYYEARGWMLSGSPVADWRALARSWQSKEKEFGRAQKKKEASFDEGILSVLEQLGT